MKTVIVAGYGHSETDFCSRHIAESLTKYYRVLVAQLAFDVVHDHDPIPNVVVHQFGRPLGYGNSGSQKITQTFRYQRGLRKLIRTYRPTWVISVGISNYGMIGDFARRNGARNAVFLPDIPPPGTAGRLGDFFVRRGWSILCHANLTWAADALKARFAQEFGKLGETPLVCHNAPRSDFLSEHTDGWLRAQLRNEGAAIDDVGGSIMIRAGAVGEGGGIEELMEAMTRLPNDFVAVMMGRPTTNYKKHLYAEIARRRLDKRMFVWNLPSDETWRRALAGADVGHMIHKPSTQTIKNYQYNSSLSNCRLFQYMAAGLPILTYDDERLDTIRAEVDCFKVARLSHLTDDIERQWRGLARDRALSMSLGIHGRQAHLRTYNWDHQFEPILQGLHQLEGTGR